MNLSDEAADLLVEKGWDPSMGARPLRRAIQRFIEDPLADEVLAQNMPPGSTVEVGVEKGAEGVDPEVKISIKKPARKRKREAVGVGASVGGDEDSPEGSVPASEDGHELPDSSDVLPDVPDAPPAPDGDGS